MLKRQDISIYLAGPLFGIADIHRNIIIGSKLRDLSYKVILPQENASHFIVNGKPDLYGIAIDCARHAASCDFIVANIDGADCDSGTALECGIAMRNRDVGLSHNNQLSNVPKVICVRTDFRTADNTEVGINAMFLHADKILYVSAAQCAVNEEAVMQLYDNIVEGIDRTIMSYL